MNKMFAKLSLSQKILFAKYLAILLGSGISLTESLKLLEKQFRSKFVKNIIRKAIEDVNNGQFLSSSLSKYKDIFGEFFINVIKIGELSGNLVINLKYLAEELRKIQNLKRKIISALVYPVFVIMATLGIIFLLIFIVFPKILPIFSALKVELPLTTKIFIAVSSFFIKYGLYILILLIVLSISFILLMRLRSFKKFVHQILLKIPLISKIIKFTITVEFCRSLGLLLKSNISLVEALDITRKNINNLVYQDSLEGITKFVSSGHNVFEYLDKYPSLFHFNMVRMIEIGETTGNLINNLFYLSEVYESEIDERLQNLTNLLEPVILVIMAAIVAFIALSIIMPIYEVTEKLGKRK
jgi:type II secretory pathway component PulF